MGTGLSVALKDFADNKGRDMTIENQVPGPDRSRLWGEFRFSVIGGLLASPPLKGELKPALRHLADKTWRHPISGEPHQFSFATIEEWYYTARAHQSDPVAALGNGRRRDRGYGKALSHEFKTELLRQYERFPDWSIKLHADNLAALVHARGELGPAPSYATIRRYMKQCGFLRKRKIYRKKLPGLELAQSRLEKKEVRSFELDHVGSLWHLDFHHGSRKIQSESGQWIEVLCLAIHDDHSRLACHVQWYTAESAQNLIHGVCQAIMKRGRPWTIMTDNGAAMKAAEFTEGLSRIGTMHTTTLPYSAYQNGKTERFWAILEGRLMAMLKDTELTLKLLNDATIAWVEGEYNREVNRETGCTPYERYTNSPDVTRPSPSWEELKMAFRMEITRNQRRSDGTITVDGTRFEIPQIYRSLDTVRIRYARWDLSLVHLVDIDGKLLTRLFPLDREGNASGQRRAIDPQPELSPEVEGEVGLPPLLARLMADFAETGLPAPYIPEEGTDEL